MAQSLTQSQISQAVSLVQTHKDRIKSVFGTLSTGTSFDPSKTTFSSSDQARLQSELGLNEEQIQVIAAVWPVYQMGYEDGQSSSSSSRS